MNHFAATGFRLPAGEEEKELEAMLERAEALAVEAGSVVEHRDGHTLRYVDASGATLTLHFDRGGSFTCMQPGFDTETEFRWRPRSVRRSDPSCRFCDVVEGEMLGEGDGNEMLYPFALTVETIGEVRKRIRFKRPGLVTFAALLEEGEVWADEETFYAAQEGEDEETLGGASTSARSPSAQPGDSEFDEDAIRSAKMGAQSLIPLGMFGGAPTSQVLAHGAVAGAVEERRNELGGGTFLLIRLETFGGTFDVCAASGEVDREALQPGSVLGGVLWLVGRPLLDEDPEEPRTFSVPWRRNR